MSLPADTAEATKAVGDFFGLPPLNKADLGDTAIAAAILLVVALLARWLARWLCAWLERSVAPKFTMVEHQRLPQSAHMGRGLAAIVAVALLNVASAAHDWLITPFRVR